MRLFFFPPPKSEYFFQQHWESEYFLRKNHNPLFKLNGRSHTEGTACLFLHFPRFSTTYRGRVFSIPRVA